MSAGAVSAGAMAGLSVVRQGFLATESKEAWTSRGDMLAAKRSLAGLVRGITSQGGLGLVGSMCMKQTLLACLRDVGARRRMIGVA